MIRVSVSEGNTRWIFITKRKHYFFATFSRVIGLKAAQARLVGVPRKIVDFRLDETCEWVAYLQCGHRQLVRHNPPWTHRHWVTTAQGRCEHLGKELECLACKLEH
jgi:hypothetical protein